ncbi:Phthiocerol synthesis polyketide synthase type I PpsC [Corynebacterium glaucum]|uniref:quinone oxidoreductase family protein n=1 Tax=Corynebacterium glaucum TaxID=187491 RepID=UPI0025B30CC1|nr:zinc-binding dehydrogenase [Corynebacterium glaucum]WJZ06992.1 Phthiocerol synthesis polyketide synthase type I PpsC [Corynebacterium glaucum]
MFAYQIVDHTGRNGLQKTELPDPVPGPGEVAIDVEIAGLGLIDALWASGTMPSNVGFVPGLEVAGKVRAIGDEVTGLAPGDEVAAILPGAGGLAQIAKTQADYVAKLPTGMDLELASVVPVNTVTAHLALTTVAQCTSGESVLVHAGMGGLGTQFGQIARLLGASRVDAVVGNEDKRKMAKELGYDNVYLRSDLGSVPENAYDIVVDPVGGEAARTAFSSLRSGGRHVRVGNASQQEDVPVSSVAHWLENKSTVGFNVGLWISAHPDQGAKSLAWSLHNVSNQSIRVDLTEVGPIEQVTEMLAALQSGRTVGKLAVRLS